MFDAGAIVGKIELKAAGFEAGKQAVARSVKDLAERVELDLRKVSASTSRIASSLKDYVSPAAAQFKAEVAQIRDRLSTVDKGIKEVGGSAEKTFGGGGKLLGASIGAFAVRQLGNDLSRLGKEAIEAQKALDEGRATTADLAEAVFAGTPVVGDFYKGIKNLALAATELGRELAAANTQAENLKGTADTIKSIQELAQGATGTLNKAGFVEDFDQDLLNVAKTQKAAIEASRAKRVAALETQLKQNNGGGIGLLAEVTDWATFGLSPQIERKRAESQARELQRRAGIQQQINQVNRSARDAAAGVDAALPRALSARDDQRRVQSASVGNVKVEIGGDAPDRLAEAFAKAMQPIVGQELDRAAVSVKSQAHAARVRRNF